MLAVGLHLPTYPLPTFSVVSTREKSCTCPHLLLHVLIASLPRIPRLRRDGRRAVEDSDRVRAALHGPNANLTAKYPLRNVPDVNGFSALTKNDI